MKAKERRGFGGTWRKRLIEGVRAIESIKAGKRKSPLRVVLPRGKPPPAAHAGMVYGTIRLTPWEILFCWLTGASMGGGIGYLFYHHPVPACIGALYGLRTPGQYKKARIKRRKEELRRQFRQSLHALISCLTAGKAVENAFSASVQDLRLIYPDPNTYILLEFERIDRRIRNGDPVEAALTDLCERAELEELRQFTEVFATCKRTGGNLAEVMRRTAHIIGDKLEIRQEIEVMLAGKRFEAKILGGAPLAVIVMLYGSSPDYMAPLYGNAAGAAVMTACLALFACCWKLTGKWMEMKL